MIVNSIRNGVQKKQLLIYLAFIWLPDTINLASGYFRCGVPNNGKSVIRHLVLNLRFEQTLKEVSVFLLLPNNVLSVCNYISISFSIA